MKANSLNFCFLSTGTVRLEPFRFTFTVPKESCVNDKSTKLRCLNNACLYLLYDEKLNHIIIHSCLSGQPGSPGKVIAPSENMDKAQLNLRIHKV